MAAQVAPTRKIKIDCTELAGASGDAVHLRIQGDADAEGKG